MSAFEPCCVCAHNRHGSLRASTVSPLHSALESLCIQWMSVLNWWTGTHCVHRMRCDLPRSKTVNADHVECAPRNTVSVPFCCGSRLSWATNCRLWMNCCRGRRRSRIHTGNGYAERSNRVSLGFNATKLERTASRLFRFTE
jgi:hypothetical protein